MKKICFLFTLCLLNFAASAITVTVNATGAAGSFKTGYTQSTAGSRTDGNMVIAATGTIRRGYAVFDLSGVVPGGATVTAVSIRFNFSTTTTGLGVSCDIGGFAGDLSTVTVPATLYADCASGTPFNTTNWGASTTGAQDLLPFNAAGNTFIQTNAGLKVSVGFYTTSGANIYTITGEGGTAATQPQLQITYNCTGVSGVTATASPNPICDGSTLTLTGTGTGTTSYSWSGPSYTSALRSPTLTATPGAAGVYTLTAFNAGGCGVTATTAPVVVYSLPPAITGTESVCAAGATTALSDLGGAGTWSSSVTAIATVGTFSGTVTGVAPGTSTITYTEGATGCKATAVVTVIAAPAPITGSRSICIGATSLLADVSGSGSGVWSSSSSSLATVGTGGIVTGVAAGIPLISYTYAGCSFSVPVSVNAAPVSITASGAPMVCPGTSVTLSDASTGGLWSSGTPAIATVGSASGVVKGVSAGTVLITYSNGCGPDAYAAVTVNPLPSAITGFPLICLASTTTFVDTTASGVWTAASAAIATVGTSGVVSGVALGAATVTYTLPATGCYVTRGVTVNPVPAPILGPDTTVCQGYTITFTDAVPGGLWTSSSTALASVSNSGVITGLSMGTAVITYTTGANCYLSRQITVNPLAPVAGRDSACVGLTTYLTDIVGGGTWVSSNLSVATVRIDSGIVSGLTPGTTTVTYLLPSGCSASASVRVIAFPGASTGTMEVCPGATVTLSNSTGGGTWSSNNLGVATVVPATGVVTGVAADTVSITYSILPGCPVYTLVTVNPLPDPIIGNLVMCPGTIDSLQDYTPGGQWGSITPALATVIDTSGIVTAISGGTATISYKLLATGCFVTKTVSVNPAPIPSITYNWMINSFQTLPGFVSYQWYDSVGLIPGATTLTVAALYDMYYYVVVTDSNGCKGASALVPYHVSEVGVKNVPGNGNIKIYPNPANGTLYIESAVKVRAVISGIEGNAELEQADAKEIDISALADGMYFITLYDNSGGVQSVQKFIKQ